MVYTSTRRATAGSEASFRAALPRGGERPGVAAYLEIEEELADGIESGNFPAGTRLPGERDLARHLGVSRMTVRQALTRLEQRGLIVRQRGRGTFVAEPKLRHDATILRGFFEQMVGQGVFPVSRCIAKEELPASAAIAQILHVRLGEPIYKVVRVRSANEHPIVLETSYFPARIVPGLVDLDLERSSIYRLMERRYGARPTRAVQSLEPVVAEPVEAGLLRVPVGSPLMLVERTAWDGRGRAVEHARDLYRGDRSRFVTELRL